MLKKILLTQILLFISFGTSFAGYHLDEGAVNLFVSSGEEFTEHESSLISLRNYRKSDKSVLLEVFVSEKNVDCKGFYLNLITFDGKKHNLDADQVRENKCQVRIPAILVKNVFGVKVPIKNSSEGLLSIIDTSNLDLSRLK